MQVLLSNYYFVCHAKNDLMLNNMDYIKRDCPKLNILDTNSEPSIDHIAFYTMKADVGIIVNENANDFNGKNSYIVWNKKCPTTDGINVLTLYIRLVKCLNLNILSNLRKNIVMMSLDECIENYILNTFKYYNSTWIIQWLFCICYFSTYCNTC